MQKEVLYFSLGGAANHASTHFWNAQQSYFDYDAPSSSLEPPLIDHDVSFKAGVGTDGHETYTPRALLFDVRSEFGSMRQYNALYGADDEENARELWQSQVIHTHERVQRSRYLERLEREDHGEDAADDAADDANDEPFRYWSDYSRVLFHPRSQIHASAPSLYGSTYLAPMDGSDEPLASGSSRFETFEQGHRVAQALEADQQLLDENVRWFAEDSDMLQGLHFSANAYDGFSGLATSYLRWIADEYPKTPRVQFSLSRMFAGHSAFGERVTRLGRIIAMNEVLALAQQAELATMLVPASLDRGWQSGEHLHVDADRISETSAVLSALLETATLGSRWVEPWCPDALTPDCARSRRPLPRLCRGSIGAEIRASHSWAAACRRHCSLMYACRRLPKMR